jgi:hypothetical protein
MKDSNGVELPQKKVMTKDMSMVDSLKVINQNNALDEIELYLEVGAKVEYDGSNTATVHHKGKVYTITIDLTD